MKIATISNQFNKYHHNNAQTKKNNLSFGIRMSMMTETEALPQVRPRFINSVRESIAYFPKKYQDILQDNRYRTIIAPNIFSALASKRIICPEALEYERRHPLLTLSDSFPSLEGDNCIVFCDKPQLPDRFVPNVVNHELAKGVVNSLELDKNDDIYTSLYTDAYTGQKLGRYKSLTPAEKNVVYGHLIDRDGDFDVREITADTLAWLNGGGKYGCGLYGANNPKLIRFMFPNLTQVLVDKKI